MKRFYVIDDEQMPRPEDLFKTSPLVEADTAAEAVAKKTAAEIRKPRACSSVAGNRRAATIKHRVTAPAQSTN